MSLVSKYRITYLSFFQSLCSLVIGVIFKAILNTVNKQ